MVNVLWAWILLILLQMIQPILCHGNERIRRAVFDIIPKYENQAAITFHEKRPTRKTVRRFFNQTENFVSTKRNSGEKLEKRKKYFDKIKFKVTDFNELKERSKQILPLNGVGYGVKKDNIEILCSFVLCIILCNI